MPKYTRKNDTSKIELVHKRECLTTDYHALTGMAKKRDKQKAKTEDKK